MISSSIPSRSAEPGRLDSSMDEALLPTARHRQCSMNSDCSMRRRARRWPPRGQTATHRDTSRHTRPRENVVFWVRAVGSSPTSGTSRPASRAGFRVPTRSLGASGGPEKSFNPGVGQLPTPRLAPRGIPRRTPSGIYFLWPPSFSKVRSPLPSDQVLRSHGKHPGSSGRGMCRWNRDLRGVAETARPESAPPVDYCQRR